MRADITSTSNPHIKALVRLRSRRQRDGQRRFLIEGYRELARAAEAAVPIETVYVCPDLFLGSNEATLVGRLEAAGASVISVATEPFRKAAYRDRPEGLLAVAPHLPIGLDLVTGGPHALILVAEAIEKPGNLGTMLRTAEAAGADAVVVADPTTDLFNPNVVRASLGTLFTVPVAMGSSQKVLQRLGGLGITTLAASPDAEIAHWEADLTGPIAIAIGSEQYGLSPAWLEAADQRVVIPMPGSVDSVNAATAAGILLFEAVRQRANRK